MFFLEKDFFPNCLVVCCDRWLDEGFTRVSDDSLR